MYSELPLEAILFEFLAQEARVAGSVDIALFVSNDFDARLLELVLSEVLHVAVDTNTPLFELSHDSLLVFGCNACDI